MVHNLQILNPSCKLHGGWLLGFHKTYGSVPPTTSPHHPFVHTWVFAPMGTEKLFHHILHMGLPLVVFAIWVYVYVLGHGSHQEIDIKEFDVERQWPYSWHIFIKSNHHFFWVLFFRVFSFFTWINEERKCPNIIHCNAQLFSQR